MQGFGGLDNRGYGGGMLGSRECGGRLGGAVLGGILIDSILHGGDAVRDGDSGGSGSGSF